jgi:nitrogen fixation/metabolism regulation signal transduction histidine kinase
VLSVAGSYLFFVEQAYLLSIFILLLIVGAVINTIKYINNTNQWISFFLLGIENEDTSLKVPKKSGNSAIDDVYVAIDRLNKLFQQTKVDIITQEQHYRKVINQSATGLFSINDKGRVININPAAIRLTGLHDYHHINTLTKINSTLPDFIMYPNHHRHQNSTIFENKYGQKLLFKLSEIKSVKETIRLVAVSDITKELDNREVDAWIKLARTLSHEIMNNIVPITTLSQVISGYFTRNEKIIDTKDIDTKIINNTVKGLSVIEERSTGLMSFVNNYRKFTKLPIPEFQEVNLSSLLENNLIAACTFPEFTTINIDKKIPENILFVTDEKLLSQVIINLLKNACEALTSEKTENPKLTVKLFTEHNTAKVEITNNGPSIPPEIREQIFIPFFTTKKEGSGVGLSLSKQIMLKMNGDILLNTTKEKLTSFLIILNQ